MFERAAQVNARFVAGTVKPHDVVAALKELGLDPDRITVFERAAAPPPPSPGWGGRLRAALGGRGDVNAPAAPAPEVQILVHMGQDATQIEPVCEVFRRFGAAGIEQFGPTQTPNRTF